MTSKVGPPLEMMVEIEPGYLARAYIRQTDFRVEGEAGVVKSDLAVLVAERLGVAPQELSFVVFESFDDGPAHMTHDWRYTEPASWAQIVESLEARSFSVVS